jgi:hypothetical protein
LAGLQRPVFHRKFAGRREQQQHTAIHWPCDSGWVRKPIVCTTRKSLSEFNSFREQRAITEAAGIRVAQ